MAKLVDTFYLEDALKKFRERGDEWWATKDELPSEGEIRVMIEETLDGDVVKNLVDEALEDADVVTHPEVGELSRAEIDAILAEAR